MAKFRRRKRNGRHRPPGSSLPPNSTHSENSDDRKRDRPTGRSKSYDSDTPRKKPRVTPPRDSPASPHSNKSTITQADHLKPGNSRSQNSVARALKFDSAPSNQKIESVSKDKKIDQERIGEGLKELKRNDISKMEEGLGIVDSVLNILTNFSCANPNFEDFFQMAADREKQLREGLNMVKKGYEKLKQAASHDLSTSSK